MGTWGITVGEAVRVIASASFWQMRSADIEASLRSNLYPHFVKSPYANLCARTESPCSNVYVLGDAFPDRIASNSQSLAVALVPCAPIVAAPKTPDNG